MVSRLRHCLTSWLGKNNKHLLPTNRCCDGKRYRYFLLEKRQGLKPEGPKPVKGSD